MSRNNQDRLGAREAHADPTMVHHVATSPGQSNTMSFVVPTEFVELPSKGVFYPEDHPLHNEECLEIKYMTAKEEDILADKSLLRKGLALDRFLKSIVLNKSIDLNSLLTCDRSAILIAARINGYGADYDTKVVCPVCFAHGRHEFDLEQKKIDLLDQQALDNLGVTVSPDGIFIIKLPQTDVEVGCRLLTGTDEKTLLKNAERRKKQKLLEASLTDQLRIIIVSVGGNTERSYINSFIDVLPAKDSRHLRTTYQACVPNVEIKEIFDCSECGAEAELEVPFTTDFFWPVT